jgi:hypothetical protein
MLRYALILLALVVAGCSGGTTTPGKTTKSSTSYMAMVADTTTGQWAIATDPLANTASYNAHAACPSCGDAGNCFWYSGDSTSPTYGALARSDNVVFLGRRQYLFGFGCGRSQVEAASKAINSCSEPDISCAVVGGASLVQ